MNEETKALKTALEAAEGAGRIILHAFRRRFHVEYKRDSSPVTEIDRASEAFIRRITSRAFPADGFLGEELGGERPDAEARWIIDPIDGTNNFIRGIPFWGVLIAREVRGRLTTGVIHYPALGETVWAERGHGAFRNGKRIRVSRVAPLGRAYVLHGGYEYLVRHRGASLLAAVYSRCGTMRAFGDCWGYSWVARGHVEAMLEATIKPWDAAAVKIVVEEAGGKMTDWRGRDTHMGPTLLATNGRVHGALIRILGKFA